MDDRWFTVTNNATYYPNVEDQMTANELIEYWQMYSNKKQITEWMKTADYGDTIAWQYSNYDSDVTVIFCHRKIVVGNEN